MRRCEQTVWHSPVLCPELRMKVGGQKGDFDENNLLSYHCSVELTYDAGTQSLACIIWCRNGVCKLVGTHILELEGTVVNSRLNYTPFKSSFIGHTCPTGSGWQEMKHYKLPDCKNIETSIQVQFRGHTERTATKRWRMAASEPHRLCFMWYQSCLNSPVSDCSKIAAILQDHLLDLDTNGCLKYRISKISEIVTSVGPILTLLKVS